MTIEELSQLYNINREIKNEEQRLKVLRDRYYSSAGPSLSGMPHGDNFESPVERLAVEIADIEEIIKNKLVRLAIEQKKIEKYIVGVSDSFMRQILTARFIDFMTWGQVARKVGGSNTADSVRMAVKRFLR